MTTLVMLAFMVFGITGYQLLPVSDLPNVDYPTIQVTANLPGANPDTMASAVATPLEREFSTIAGIDSMTSTNGNGITQITLQFTLDRNIDAAAQDVQAAIAKAARQLPQDMPNPPSYRKVNPADQPVLYVALSSPTLPLSEVNEYADTIIAPRISMINGVAQVVDPYWTQPGIFSIYEKKPVETMSGTFEADRSDYYYLESVPWTMYYDGKRALHGAYWHSNLGYQMSHGCANLSLGDSHWLYDWAHNGDVVYVYDPSGRTPTDASLYGAGAP